MVHARDAPDPMAEWIALVDAADHLRCMVLPTLGAMAQVSTAIDALLTHEHTLTDTQRQTARERLWQRDHADPLPTPLARVWWAVCQCRSCTLARHSDQRQTVWQAQAQAVRTRKGK